MFAGIPSDKSYGFIDRRIKSGVAQREKIGE
jgi:hypothetical protein